MASQFSAIVDQALAEKKIAGGAAIVIDKHGRTLIKQEFGKAALTSNAVPFSFESTFWIASSTKLLASVAALQCVERGRLNLDDDITDILTEWKDAKILTGFDEKDQPVLVKAKEKITLRRLLTHSSGIAYIGLGTPIDKYRKVMGITAGVSLKANRFSDHEYPLIFEPGTAWIYGTGNDWVGCAIERVSGLKLGDFMEQNIFAPLGMKYTTFDPLDNKEVMRRMVERMGRDPQSQQLIADTSDHYTISKREDHFGGNGLYSCADDYIKVLESLLLDDGKLLRKGGEMYHQLFRPQLENPAAFTAAATGPGGAFFAPGYPRDPKVNTFDYALGGAIVNTAAERQVAKGTLYWSGFTNNHWYIDRENGIAGYYAGSLVPPGDIITADIYAEMQKAALKEAKISGKL